MTLYDSMVESYAPKSAAERVAVQQEVMQLIALAGLARGGFFEKAAFYGTVLRGHGLFASCARPLV